MFYEKIFKELTKNKVQYLIVGGTAVNLHGFYRLTGDLDIIILLKDNNVKKFIQMANKLKLKPGVPVKLIDFAVSKNRDAWIKEKNMKAFMLHGPENEQERLDIVIDHGLNFDEIYKRRVIIKAGELRLSVISIKDLIKMKKMVNRERDKIDVKALQRIQELKNDQKT